MVAGDAPGLTRQSTAWRAVFIASIVVSGLIILQAATGAAWLAWARAPLLMPFVLGWTLLTRPVPTRRILVPLLIAQVFSFFGDLLLAAEGQFVPGVAMFLLAQVAYIVTFLGWRGPHLIRLKPWTVLPYAAYLAAMLIVVVPRAGELALPIVVYGTTLCAMAAVAMDATARIEPRSARALLIGTILFVISDSMIALTKFEVVAQGAIAATILIGTYCAAQILIALGVLGGRAGRP